MAMSGKFMCCVAAALLAVCQVSAQRIPVDYNYRGMTFQGPLFLPSTAVFTDCHFKTDSVVLERSFGAVFKNCTFESKSNVLYLAAEGTGMMLVDCEVNGPENLFFSKKTEPTDRNYLIGLKLNGQECESDESPVLIDLEGLEMGEAVRKASLRNETLFARIKETDNTLTLIGIEDDMFVGWKSDNPDVNIVVTADPRTCIVTGKGNAVVSAYTEYGIEASKLIMLK